MGGEKRKTINSRPQTAVGLHLEGRNLCGFRGLVFYIGYGFRLVGCENEDERPGRSNMYSLSTGIDKHQCVGIQRKYSAARMAYVKRHYYRAGVIAAPVAGNRNGCRGDDGG